MRATDSGLRIRYASRKRRVLQLNELEQILGSLLTAPSDAASRLRLCTRLAYGPDLPLCAAQGRLAIQNRNHVGRYG